ncbi:hypothetical protein B0H12DRAFT_1228994 [Mycena haematopus]|nr:hypothetical protein B0H12DRAFT_1228994 [Mycena haematopus]
MLHSPGSSASYEYYFRPSARTTGSDVATPPLNGRPSESSKLVSSPVTTNKMTSLKAMPTAEVNVEKTAADALVDKIKEFHEFWPDSQSMELPDVEAIVWEQLSDCSETMDYRVEYDAQTKIVIVTWPGDIHECFTVALDCFQTIHLKETSFQCFFNKSLPFGWGPREGSEFTPDFLFARSTADKLQYLIALECAASQTTEDLATKIDILKSFPGIALVIGIDLQGPKFASPKWAPLTRLTPNELDEEMARCPPLGPITIHDHNWAHIENIVVTIHATDLELESYDITPLPLGASKADRDALEDRQDAASLAIGAVTKDLIQSVDNNLWASCFTAERPWEMKWEALYRQLPLFIRTQTHVRYTKWCLKNRLHAPVPQFTTGSTLPSAAKRARESAKKSAKEDSTMRNRKRQRK